MKKLLLFCILAILTVSVSLPVVMAEDGTAGSSDSIAEGWMVPEGFEGRVAVTKTDEGIVIDQLVQGTPSSHAVAIALPVDGTDSYEVTLSIEMEEYVASGRLANDVWTGVGFMGKPEFIHWRNNETDGYAKDSPGFFTRFFNYAGEYRIITDIYQEKFNNGTDVVDTWTLLDTAVGASVSQDLTIKLSWDQESDGEWYNLYINGKKMSAGAEFMNADRDVLFPEGKIYLMIAMNTQEKETNMNSRVTVKSINGTSYVTEPETPPADDGGCGSAIGGSSLLLGSVCALSAAAFGKRGRKKK